MAHLNQFSYGWVTPVLAYLFSFVGSWLGLKATSRARLVTGAARSRWLTLAAWAIGGTGIWVMHFIAMLGFEVDGTAVQFSLPITIASWLTAIVVVGIGLFIVGYGKRTPVKVIAGGVFTGVGVAGMHYSGMYAMRVSGMAMYDMRLVWASVVIAVVAATVALWFATAVESTIAIIGASAIMAAAVCGMHFTGMAALSVRMDAVPHPVSGTSALSFVIPIIVFVVLVFVALGYAMLNTPSAPDKATLEALETRISGVATAPETRSGFFR